MTTILVQMTCYNLDELISELNQQPHMFVEWEVPKVEPRTL